MDESNIGDPTQYKTSNFQDQYYDDNIDSELFLSKIQFLPPQSPESPKFNVIAVEAKIKELTKTADSFPIKKSKPFCGCGQYYSCTSSLYLHIRSKHEGIAPAGTIGGPKGIVKKPQQDPQEFMVKLQEQEGKYNMYQSYNNKPQNTSYVQTNQDKSRDLAAYVQARARRNQNGNKTCKICNKSYSCNSSLNLHLKRKHQMKRGEDGRIELDTRVQDRQPSGGFGCSICGLSYGSKSALGLHYNNKHNAKNGSDQLPYSDQNIQKCGCGLIYQSRSALNMHVKKKHLGVYPVGTSEKPNLRTKGRSSDQYIMQGSDEEKLSIYDSDSEGQNDKQKQLSVESQRVYKCGCGRNYSCSSSLNLHIKKNHKWIVPKGTIGGPRGIRNEEERQQRFEQRFEQKQKNESSEVKSQLKNEFEKCCECNNQLRGGSIFHCRSCDNHKMCSNCFWSKDNFQGDHDWSVENESPNK